MRKKMSKRKNLKAKSRHSSVKSKAAGAKNSVKSAVMNARSELPIQVQRIQSILSEKAVDFALPITKMLQAKLSVLESKLSRA